MNDSLNAALALARQQFQDLTSLVTLDQLRAFDFGDGAKRHRVVYLLEVLNRTLGTIKRELEVKDGLPVIQAGASHIEFFRQELEPNASIIERASLESIGLLDLYDVVEQARLQSPSPRIKRALRKGLFRWYHILDEDELSREQDDGYGIEGALDLVEAAWFEPDQWLFHNRLLRPVLLDRPVRNVSRHVRVRLSEIYRAFTFGLWLSSMALSRSLLEYCLKDRASAYAVEKMRTSSRGELEERSLRDMCDDYALRIPSLSKALETVRTTGNSVMHINKHAVVALPVVLREEALQCIKSIGEVLETVYADTGAQN